MNGPKEGSEGLPYKDAGEVIGGPADNQPAPGLAPDFEVSGGSTVKAPKDK